MAGATGLEPAASSVTGKRYNQLNYAPAESAEYKRYQSGPSSEKAKMPPLVIKPTSSKGSHRR